MSELKLTRRDMIRASLYGGAGLAAASLMPGLAMAAPEEQTEAAGPAAGVRGGWWSVSTSAGGLTLAWDGPPPPRSSNINITEVGPVDFNGADQATMMEQVVASKPDAIIMTPLDPDQLVDPCRKATEAGIPVMIFNSDIRDSRYRVGLIGMQNYNGGYLQGQYVLNNLLKGKKAKAACHDHPRRGEPRKPQGRPA